MNKKIFPLTIIGLIVLSLVALPYASATPEITSYFDGQSSFYEVYIAHPSLADPPNIRSAVGQSFTPSTNIYLTSAQFYLKRTGNPNFNLKAEIFEVANYTTAPSGSPLEISSNSLASSAVSTSAFTWYSFTFAQTTLLQASKYYVIVIYTADFVFGQVTTDKIDVGRGGTGHAGSIVTHLTGAWASSTSYDACFRVYGDLATIPTPSPTPTDDYKWDENTNSWSWWNGTHWIPSSGPSPTANAQIVTFTGNMITYIVPLALLLLPAVVGAWALGRAGAAKWGFIAGLNIGAIMCYLYLPAFGLWAVIAIVMVDVLMIFASTRGGD